MLGQYGRNELAAVGLANQIFFLVSVIGMGIMTALTSIVATSRGAGNHKECGEFLRSAIELSFIISMLVCGLSIALAVNFSVFQQSEVINVIAGKYLTILSISVFPMLLFLALKHFSDGIAYTKPAMLITMIGVLINIFFNWVFIFGNLSFPALGAPGAAIGTLLTRLIMALLLVIVIFRMSRVKEYLPPLISTYKTAPVIKKLLRLGFPTGLQIFFEVGAYVGATIFAGWVSLDALAAHQIGMGVVAFCYMIATGIAVSGSVKLAHAFGEGDKKKVKDIGVVALLVVAIAMMLTSSALYIFRDQVINIFTNDNLVIQVTGGIFLTLILFQMLNGIQSGGIGLLRGLEDVAFPAKFTLLSYWLLGLPLAYFLGIVYDMKLNGIWIGLLSALSVNAGILLTRFFVTVNKGKIKSYTAAELETL